MFARGPVYQLLAIDLSVAGSKPFNDTVGLVQFTRAVDQSGALALDAKLNLTFGDVGTDPIPLSINSIVRVRQTVPIISFDWTAQPGVTAYILIAANDDVVVQSPPARQMVTQAMGSAVSALAVTVGTVATVLAASSTTRQKASVRNNSTTATLYLGDATVTTATGFPLGPGEGFTFEGTTAAIYGIASAAGTDARVMVEG